MPTSAGMKDSVRIYKKGEAGTSPELWMQVGDFRRAQIQRMSDRSALETGAALAQTAFQPTHRGLVETSTDYQVGRVLVRKHDDVNFYVLRVTDIGRRRAGVPSRYLQLVLSEMPTAVKTA